MNVIRHTADNAAYEAARTAMVPGATAAEASEQGDQFAENCGGWGRRSRSRRPS